MKQPEDTGRWLRAVRPRAGETGAPVPHLHLAFLPGPDSIALAPKICSFTPSPAHTPSMESQLFLQQRQHQQFLVQMRPSLLCQTMKEPCQICSGVNPPQPREFGFSSMSSFVSLLKTPLSTGHGAREKAVGLNQNTEQPSISGGRGRLTPFIEG